MESFTLLQHKLTVVLDSRRIRGRRDDGDLQLQLPEQDDFLDGADSPAGSIVTAGEFGPRRFFQNLQQRVLFFDRVLPEAPMPDPLRPERGVGLVGDV